MDQFFLAFIVACTRYFVHRTPGPRDVAVVRWIAPGATDGFIQRALASLKSG